MNWVEGNVVDGVNVLEVGGSVDPMAFKREIVLRIHRVEVLNGDASFDGAERVPGRRFLLHVVEDGYAAMLILQRTLVALEFLRLILQRVDYDVTVGRPDDSHWILNVGGVAALGKLKLQDRIRLSEVPELQSFIPAA